MNKDYQQYLCGGCRQTIFLPRKGVDKLNFSLFGWIRTGDGSIFCSKECEAKGPPKRIRQPITIHIDFSSDASFDFKAGAYDAVSGFEQASDREAYKEGYILGEYMRGLATTAKAKVSKE